MRFVYSILTAFLAASVAAEVPYCSTGCFNATFPEVGCGQLDEVCQCIDKYDSINILVTSCIVDACSPADVDLTLKEVTRICAKAEEALEKGIYLTDGAAQFSYNEYLKTATPSLYNPNFPTHIATVPNWPAGTGSEPISSAMAAASSEVAAATSAVSEAVGSAESVLASDTSRANGAVSNAAAAASASVSEAVTGGAEMFGGHISAMVVVAGAVIVGGLLI